MKRNGMRRGGALLLMLAGAVCGSAIADAGQDAIVFGDPGLTEVTPFYAQEYAMEDPQAIADTVFGDQPYEKTWEADHGVEYTADTGVLSCTFRDGAFLKLESEVSKTIFTPIKIYADYYAMLPQLKQEELSFMSRADAGRAAEQLMMQVFSGMEFRMEHCFSITQSDYDALFEQNREELDARFSSGSKMDEDLRPQTRFDREELGYLMELVQIVNGVPVTRKAFNSSMTSSATVDLWLLWTPEGCRYIRTVGSFPVQPLQDAASCTIISAQEAQAAAEAVAKEFIKPFLTGPDTEPKGIREIELVWFADGELQAVEKRFQPVWAVHMPLIDSWGGVDVGFFVDACTGEAWIGNREQEAAEADGAQ